MQTCVCQMPNVVFGLWKIDERIVQWLSIIATLALCLSLELKRNTKVGSELWL